MNLKEARNRLARQGYRLAIEHEPHPVPDTKLSWRHDLLRQGNVMRLLICSNHSEGRWAINCWTWEQACKLASAENCTLEVQLEQAHISHLVESEEFMGYLATKHVVDEGKQWAHWVVKAGLV